MSEKLKSRRAVRTFTYDPEPFLEMNATEPDEDISQKAFDDYVIDCAVEDFGVGRDHFNLLPSKEDEQAERDDFTLDAICIWEWYVENKNYEAIPCEEGAYSARQYVIDHITPAVRDVWRIYEEVVGHSYGDSFDWAFIPDVLSSWHDAGDGYFKQMVEDKMSRRVWTQGFAERNEAKWNQMLQRKHLKKVTIPLERLIPGAGAGLVLDQEPMESICPGNKIIIPGGQEIEITIDTAPRAADISIHDREQLEQFTSDDDE